MLRDEQRRADALPLLRGGEAVTQQSRVGVGNTQRRSPRASPRDDGFATGGMCPCAGMTHTGMARDDCIFDSMTRRSWPGPAAARTLPGRFPRAGDMHGCVGACARGASWARAGRMTVCAPEARAVTMRPCAEMGAEMGAAVA